MKYFFASSGSSGSSSSVSYTHLDVYKRQQIDHADIKAMTAEIQKIGVNVNQIARRVNATGNAYQEEDVYKRQI